MREHRARSATGGVKGRKLARFSLIPPEPLWWLAEHYGRGAAKYADRNWERGYPWSWSLDALERHVAAVKLGEWEDPELRSPHLCAVLWHACALLTFAAREIGVNDLPGLTVPRHGGFPGPRPRRRHRQR